MTWSLGYGAVLYVFLAIQFFTDDAAVVQEKSASSCNTPCNRQPLTCPRGYRIAIREALFSVHQRSLVTPCVPTETCEGESMCCEDPEVHDCVFSYSPSHLEALHRNCSGGRECEVKTERTQEESVACPFFNPQDTVSHTILDYVCIEDKAMLDICTPSETTVLGRTLFAMLDSRTWRSPLGGAVCRCTAESAQWPTTNTISVFVVDIRLNVLRQAQCSKADLVLRSGSTTRHLDCATSRDPRLAYPFVALLNHSNVATIELFLHSKLPEYIWIGFESNEPEDIRLSCGLQGYIPLDIDDAATRGNGSAGGFYGQSSGVLPAGAISGILVAVMVVLAVAIVLIVLFVKIRREKRRSRSEPYSEPLDKIDDVYYSMPDVTSPPQGKPESTASRAGKKNKKKSKAEKPKGGLNDDGSEVYVTAEEVRERKRKSEKKRVRIVSIPEISNDVEEDYASPWDIQERRRRDGHPSFSPELPPRVSSPAKASAPEERESDSYATLDRTPRRSDQPAVHNQEEDVSYDHLSLTSVDKGEKMDRTRDSDRDSKAYGVYERPEPDGCNQNNGFQEDDVFE